MTRRRLLTSLLIAPVLLLSAASIPTLDETTYPSTLAAHKGRVVLVNFWATYCVPCRAEMPQLLKLQQKLKARGFELITISADETEQEAQAAQFIQKNNIPAPFFRKQAKNDDKFINGIDAKWSGELPASFLYDKSGRKVKSYFGEVKLADVERDIDKLL